MTQLLDRSLGFDAALETLRGGGLVAVPTETVYGLAADATNAAAVAGIYEAKGRPSFNPLISHVSDLEMAQRYGVFNERALRLAHEFWPGPLTLVVPLAPKAKVADAVTANLPTIALRQPKGTMAQLSKALDVPLAAPSANSSGRISPTTALHVMDDLGGRIDLILDEGPCDVGLESTIVKVTDTELVLLREGGVTRDALEAVVGPVSHLEKEAATRIEAPGMMLAHYAPRKPLRLNAGQARADEALLAFGPQVAGHKAPALNLSESGDLQEAAHNLFAYLTQLDDSDAAGIAVQSIPMTGIGAAINDRLARAAVPHDTQEADDG